MDTKEEMTTKERNFLLNHGGQNQLDVAMAHAPEEQRFDSVLHSGSPFLHEKHVKEITGRALNVSNKTHVIFRGLNHPSLTKEGYNELFDKHIDTTSRPTEFATSRHFRPEHFDRIVAMNHKEAPMWRLMDNMYYGDASKETFEHAMTPKNMKHSPVLDEFFFYNSHKASPKILDTIVDAIPRNPNLDQVTTIRHIVEHPNLSAETARKMYASDYTYPATKRTLEKRFGPDIKGENK